MINPFDDGYDAFLRGEDQDANPYAKDTPDPNSWKDGWVYAEDSVQALED